MIKVVTNIYIIRFNEIYVNFYTFIIQFANVNPSYQHIIFLNINIYSDKIKLYINLLFNIILPYLA